MLPSLPRPQQNTDPIPMQSLRSLHNPKTPSRSEHETAGEYRTRRGAPRSPFGRGNPNSHRTGFTYLTTQGRYTTQTFTQNSTPDQSDHVHSAHSSQNVATSNPLKGQSRNNIDTTAQQTPPKHDRSDTHKAQSSQSHQSHSKLAAIGARDRRRI